MSLVHQVRDVRFERDVGPDALGRLGEELCFGGPGHWAATAISTEEVFRTDWKGVVSFVPSPT